MKNLKRQVKRREGKIEHISEKLQNTEEELMMVTDSLRSVKAASTALEEKLENIAHQKVRLKHIKVYASIIMHAMQGYALPTIKHAEMHNYYGKCHKILIHI